MNENNQGKAKMSTANIVGLILLSIALALDLVVYAMDFRNQSDEDLSDSSKVVENTEEDTAGEIEDTEGEDLTAEEASTEDISEATTDDKKEAESDVSVSQKWKLMEGIYVRQHGEVSATAEFTHQELIHQNMEFFYCTIYAMSDDASYGYVDGILEDNGDGTYTGTVDGGTFDIIPRGSSIVVVTYPEDESYSYIFEELEGEYSYYSEGVNDVF